MNRSRLVFWFLLLTVAVLTGGCLGSSKKRDPETNEVVRFMLESPARNPGALVRLPKSGTSIAISPKSYFTEYDVVKCDVIENELGKALVFELTPQAGRDLYRLSVTNQGLRLVTVVNGVAVGAQRINTPISNGYIITYVEVDEARMEEMAKNITETSAEARKDIEKRQR